MKLISIVFAAVLAIFSVFLFSGMQGAAGTNLDDEVARIFQQNCSTSGCHQGRFPAMNLKLENNKFKDSLADATSQELQHLKLVDTKNPEKSYLLMKIKGDKAISGKQMPLNAPPLQAQEIQAVETWIRNFPARIDDKRESDTGAEENEKSTASQKKRRPKPAFWGVRLINLPTTQFIDKGKVLFRISHRYFPALSDGYDSFYGLDGPAAILLSLGYGFSDRLSLTLARSNRFKEVELSVKWIMLEQGKSRTIPLSAALNIGASLITDTEEGEKVFQSENMKFNAQLSLSHQISNAFSLLLVPAYSSNTNHWEESSKGTFSLGIGARYMFLEDFSLIAEWIPVLTGYKDNSSGWGFGVEKKIGGHVFQVFLTNSIGMTSAQFVPGGSLRLQDGDFRIGFNIFRLF